MKKGESNTPERYYFGHWSFNVHSGNLFDGKTTTRLEPQVAKLLAFFVAHQNSLTSRDELIAVVWEGRNVSDDAINRCISILRHHLSPDDKNAYIETVVRRGFISHFPPPPNDKKEQAGKSIRRSSLIIIALAILGAAIFYSSADRVTESPQPIVDSGATSPPMLAVLPFATSGMKSDDNFLANGIHDDLLTLLAQLQSVRVISRTSVLEYRDTQRNIRDIGRDLGADVILEGRIQQFDDQIRINVQLIDVRTDEHLWAQQFDREFIPANVFNVQTEITKSIASALHSKLTEQETTEINVIPTDNMAAYRAYHRALDIRDTLNLSHPTYLEALEEAVALDPTYVRAWAELAGYLSFKIFGQPDMDLILRNEQILEKIRLLAPQSAEYLIAQAYYTYYVLKHYDTAHQLISQAHSLTPSDERVLELKSWIERRQGDFQARNETIVLAQKLDPKNLMWTRMLIYNFIVMHKYDEASNEAEKYLSQDLTAASFYNMLKMREHQNPSLWVKDSLLLQKEFEMAKAYGEQWEASIANRDFARAQLMVDAIKESAGADYNFMVGLYSGVDLNEFVTVWFLQASGQLASLIEQIRVNLDDKRNADGEYIDASQYLVMAFVNAAQGNADEAERLIRVWRRKSADDLALLIGSWHLSCRALGMAGATTAAVDCIRSGLVKPSFVMPFIEPALPYYDSIRNQPEFEELMVQIRESENI